MACGQVGLPGLRLVALSLAVLVWRIEREPERAQIRHRLAAGQTVTAKTLKFGREAIVIPRFVPVRFLCQCFFFFFFFFFFF